MARMHWVLGFDMCTTGQRKLINMELEVLTFVETERENSSVRRKL